MKKREKIALFIKDKYKRVVPQKHHLKDSILHSVLGEKIFDNRLWLPSKHNLAMGFAIGIFVALTPTIGFQMLMAGIIAFSMKVNLPAAIASVWVTNPVTAPIIYAVEYKIGSFILGGSSGIHRIRTVHDLFSNFYEIAKPLTLGSIILGTFCAVLTYLIVYYLYDFFSKVKHIKQEVVHIKEEVIHIKENLHLDKFVHKRKKNKDRK